MRFDDDGDVDMEQEEALQEKRTKLDIPVAADAEDEVMADAETTKEISAPVEKDCGLQHACCIWNTGVSSKNAGAGININVIGTQVYQRHSWAEVFTPRGR
ncbi:Protein of unknown function [Pyronema omphalodes CBS 100304]|uniref:Uncharacterized protein n=1 Tax=Pyronema omphalodes (strain CBS 100304) TaxID=1076935 RepID=U4KY29_PYROM|nr:Protein of unknown function [Pyronema omphalodes CBS 100304]